MDLAFFQPQVLLRLPRPLCFMSFFPLIAPFILHSYMLFVFLLKTMYQNIERFALLFTFTGWLHLQVAIYPNRWCQRLVSIDSSESHVFCSSQVCSNRAAAESPQRAARLLLLNLTDRRNVIPLISKVLIFLKTNRPREFIFIFVCRSFSDS